MAVTAALKFTQGMNTNTPGKSFKATVGGGAVTIANNDNTGVNNWTYVLLDAPRESALVPGTLSTGASPTTTLTPDVPGSYRIQETITGPGGSGSQIRTVVVANARGWILPGYLNVAEELDFPDPVSPNARGWAAMLDVIFLSILAVLDKFDALFSYAAGVGSVLVARFRHTVTAEQVQDERQINERTPSDTPALIVSYDTADNRVYVVKGFIVAQSADLAEYAYWNIDAFLKNEAGTLSLETASPITEEENNTTTPTLVLDVDGDDIELTFTGVTGVPMRVSGRVLIHEIISVPDL